MREKAILMGLVLLFVGMLLAAEQHGVETGASPESVEHTPGNVSHQQPLELEGFGLGPGFTTDPGVCSAERIPLSKPPFVPGVPLYCPLGACNKPACKFTHCGAGCAGRCDSFGCCNCDHC